MAEEDTHIIDTTVPEEVEDDKKNTMLDVDILIMVKSAQN